VTKRPASGRGRGQPGNWRNRTRPAPAASPDIAGNDESEERRARPPVMFRSRVQLATTYASGVLFTWEGAKGICRAVPIDRGEAVVADATKLKFAPRWRLQAVRPSGTTTPTIVRCRNEQRLAANAIALIASSEMLRRS
jgi:hypothetical protein